MWRRCLIMAGACCFWVGKTEIQICCPSTECAHKYLQCLDRDVQPCLLCSCGRHMKIWLEIIQRNHGTLQSTFNWRATLIKQKLASLNALTIMTKSAWTKWPPYHWQIATEDRDSFHIHKGVMIARADSRIRIMVGGRVESGPSERIHRTCDGGELTGRMPGFCDFVSWFFFPLTFSYFLKISMIKIIEWRSHKLLKWT
jgi:hypothetical protein